METITETHNCIQHRDQQVEGKSSPNGYIYITAPASMAAGVGTIGDRILASEADETVCPRNGCRQDKKNSNDIGHVSMKGGNFAKFPL